MEEILEILEKDARISHEDIAKMLKKKPQDVRIAIKRLEKDGVILKYKAVINKGLLKSEEFSVRAIIEVKITPQKDVGFDRIAERIYSFPEVASCYLLSGTYDLLLVVEGKNIQTVANFVAEKLSCLENVRGTATLDVDIARVLDCSRAYVDFPSPTSPFGTTWAPGRN